MLNAKAMSEKNGNGERILVVDDSRETVRHLAETLLPTFGFNSSYALDGRAALEKIRTESPDLVMLDLNLPHMTGIDVLQALALETHRPPVVLMTGGGSEQSAVEAFRLGVKDYLVKPFTMDEVLETIQRTLDRHRDGEVVELDEDDQLGIAQNEIRRQKANFDQLLAISKSLTSLSDLNTIIDQALRIALDQTEAEQSTLWLLNSDRNRLMTYQFRLDKGGVYTLGDLQNVFAERVMQSGKLLRDTEFSNGLDVGQDRRARSILYVPIILHDETIGVLGVSHIYAPHAFSEIDESFLSAISSYASIAISNATKVQKSRSTNASRIRDLVNLVSISNSLVSEPAEKTIRDALFYAYNRWQIEACSVWLVNDDRLSVKFFTNMGIGSDTLPNTELPMGAGFVGYVAETGKWIYSNAVGHHPRHNTEVDEKTGFHTRSILCIPLTYQGKVLGALQLLNRVDGDFTEKDVDQAMSIASVIALAIQLMHCNEVRE